MASAFAIQVPNVIFKTRAQTNVSPGFEWRDVTTVDMFANKRVVLFSLPGAFTPTCSSTHLPGYEAAYDEIRSLGVDEVYCLSVNDSFVMNAWFKSMMIEKVKPIPDGSAEFTRKFGFLVEKDNLGFGMRSWRYSMVIENGVVEQMFVEPNSRDNAEDDPFFVSDAQTMLEYLREQSAAKAA